MKEIKAMKDMYCYKGKMRCPILDKSSNGQKWCNGGNPIGNDWEICPMPKRRDKAIKAKEKSK